jgi:hypothetical protein
MIIQNKSLPLNLKIRVEVSNERKKKKKKNQGIGGLLAVLLKLYAAAV